MKEKTIKLYDYNELSDKAKVKALENHNEHAELYFLEDDLNDYLSQLLEDAQIKGEAELFYSLSNCQGDGVCFVGDFEHKGFTFRVSHEGRYYHSNSVNIELIEDDEDDGDDLKADLIEITKDEAEQYFKDAYKEICDKIEKRGYAEIEYEQSEEYFKDICEANEYTFRENGEIEYY